MYLKSLKIENFRKFGVENNIIEFVDSSSSLQEDSIDIASSSTLIVGKNNSGKTTITKALEKIVKKEKKFVSHDFNFNYLNKLLEEYKRSDFTNSPYLFFEIIIGINENNFNDIVTNFIPFINIENITQDREDKEIKIIIKYEVVEVQTLRDEIRRVIAKYDAEEKKIFSLRNCSITTNSNIKPFWNRKNSNKFKYIQKMRYQKTLEVISKTDFELNYYDSNNVKIDKTKFKIDNLINIELISANKIINDNSLSKTFSKIIEFKYKSQKHNLEEHIDNINENMTNQVSTFSGNTVNSVLHEIEDNKKFEISLSSNMTVDKLLQDLIKYEYLEENIYIPEGQFGLGYANLMSIIGQLIEYIEKYPSDQTHSKLNLICIEEPEAFMHPQMQELFIKNINKAISKLLDGSNKKINSQLIITTHSSHILNSKIHESNSFDNINYIMTENKISNVINLKDSIIIDNQYSPNEDEALKFIKKHIKFKVSELFFADAILFVEGITEETLLQYYLSVNEGLNKKYITVFNINGAYGHIYYKLINMLKIPTVIITDLDIKKTDIEKMNIENGYIHQRYNLSCRKTTNETIKKFNNSDDITNIPNYLVRENLYLCFQGQKIHEYFATSLEEAIILTNYDNEILNKVIKKVKPNIYSQIVGGSIDKEEIKKNSFKLQNKLSSSKSTFLNTLFYELTINDDIPNHPVVPKYINDAFVWLQNELKSGE